MFEVYHDIRNQHALIVIQLARVGAFQKFDHLCLACLYLARIEAPAHDVMRITDQCGQATGPRRTQPQILGAADIRFDAFDTDVQQVTQHEHRLAIVAGGSDLQMRHGLVDLAVIKVDPGQLVMRASTVRISLDGGQARGDAGGVIHLGRGYAGGHSIRILGMGDQTVAFGDVVISGNRAGDEAARDERDDRRAFAAWILQHPFILTETGKNGVEPHFLGNAVRPH